MPAYDQAQVSTVLDRSVFYLPLFGAVYCDKLTALIPNHPTVRGLVIHNHGCGGMWGWETTVAQFYYREGFAVITPEFVTREGNKLGCPGGSTEEMLRQARAREGGQFCVEINKVHQKEKTSVLAFMGSLCSATTPPRIKKRPDG